MTIKFNDGIQFDTDGPLRITRKRDGYYVIGEGLLVPVDSSEEGRQLIEELEATKKTNRRD